MAEDDPTIFDPSMKKKKKKKKTPFDLDAALGGDSPSADGTEAHEEPAQPEPEKEVPDTTADDLMIDDDFSNLPKKKKKKKKPFDLSELDDVIQKEEKTDTAENEGTTAAPVDDLDDLDLNFTTKKKKKKKAVILDDQAGDEAGEDADTTDGQKVSGSAWINSDRDYTYEELLKRVFDIMREKNPDMVAGERKKFNTKPPRVMRVGTKKTSFSNFKEICKALHRQPEHLLAFLFAELGTSGSIDGNDQLIIKGRFQQKQIENVLRSYIKEYVTCHTCKSRDTLLQKDTRLYFLQCETCGSRCSVTSIKSGFQAFTGKRAAIRAKTS